MSETTEAPKLRRKREGGDYFAVPLSLAEEALKLGLDPALAFLAMARGSGGDNRTTFWSANAIEKRGILSRHAATRAIRALEEADLCSRPAAKTTSKRKLAPLPPIPALRRDGPPERAPTAWLPNVLVDGVDGRKPPLALLREARSPDALRLLLRIYAACDLERHSGVPVQDLRAPWLMEHLGDRGAYRIYGVKPGTDHAKSTDLQGALAESFLAGETAIAGGKQHDVDWRAFFAAVEMLHDLRLITRTGYVFDAPAGEGHPLFPFSGGEEAEAAFAARMQAAARAALIRPLRGAGKKSDAFKGYDRVVVVPRHITPHAIGIFRPRYIADNEPSRRWLARTERLRNEAGDLP